MYEEFWRQFHLKSSKVLQHWDQKNLSCAIMNYDAALDLIRDKCLAKKHPAYGFVSIATDDFDPAMSSQDLYQFCRWLHDSGYTQAHPSKHDDSKWFIHPSKFALITWGIDVP